MTQSTKLKKGRVPELTSSSVKATKTSDTKLDPKQPSQATPEQLRLAHIMKTEDPNIKDKLKQVMDATQKSEDEAYIALHDCDNDPNRAVNLLLEGGTKNEWSTSSKKKKPRTVSEKTKETAVEAPVVSTQPEEEDWSTFISSDSPPKKTVEPGSAPSNGRGRFPKSSRGRGFNNNTTTNDTEKLKSGKGRGHASTNGPTNGKVRLFRGGRQNSRGRGGARGCGFRRRQMMENIENWANDLQDDLQSNHHSNVQVIEEWDNEYTGSLANSQVFTPSTHIESSVPDVDLSIIAKREKTPETTPNDVLMMGSSGDHILPSQLMSHFAAVAKRASDNQLPLNKTMKLPELYNNYNSAVISSQTSNSLSSLSDGRGFAHMGMNKPHDNVYILGRGRNVQFSRNLEENNARLGRIPKSTKPRLPPTSKIPLTAVEMPPETDASLGLLDVQFGALDFGEAAIDAMPNSIIQSEQSTPSPPVAETFATQPISANNALLNNDSHTFSPVATTGSNALPSQLSDVTSKMSQVDTSVSSLYQDYQSSLYTKPPQANYNSHFPPSQAYTSTSAIYSSSNSATNSTYSSSVGNYGSNSYPSYQYPSSYSQAVTSQSMNSNSYQSVVGASQQYGINSQSVYGNSNLGSSSYSVPYQTYNNSSHHSQIKIATTKEFDSPSSGVNLGSITHTGTISGTSTLLSSSQSNPQVKTTGSTTINKGAVVTNMPPGVQPLVHSGAQYIMGQTGVPYFQQPPVYYEDVQFIPPRMPPHISGYYDPMGIQASTTRENVPYNINDARYARAENSSPVQVSSLGQQQPPQQQQQQSGTQGHQQPLLNTGMPPAYAYFYGGIPGNFQFGTPALYPSNLQVAATGTNTGHGTSSSGSYGKGPTSYGGTYSGIYESSQQSVGDYKNSTSQQGPKAPQTQNVNPSTSSDMSIYSSKTHSGLSKVGSYDKPGFNCATPPPFNLGSQSSGMGPGGYPQHLYMTMTPHHQSTMIHQPMHQDSGSSVSARSQVSNQAKVSKTNYNSSTYWAQN